MDPIALAASALVALAAMLGAAVWHGRALRREREHAGHLHVVFGGENHPWVEAHWRAERFRFWPLAGGLAGAAAGAHLAGIVPDGGVAAVLALLVAPALAFVVTGALSRARLARARKAKPS
ncbi:MAG TPA: hypothetical protein VM889_06210 [Candidatus Thermoplasmatota archaeon]|nr:hypothetical protein [Candidatus Thermoplasmatota archaeon]